MKMPKAAPASLARFEQLLPEVPDVASRSMFGQPAAFVNDQMFLGVFGDEVFVRLSEKDREEALRIPGAHLFEPMAGRPMREYVVLPESVLADARAARGWVARSVAWAARLPPKTRAPRRARSPTR